MAEIIFTDAKCAECEKELPKFSIAIVVQPDFIVCPECHEEVEEGWQAMQMAMSEQSAEWAKCSTEKLCN